VNRPLVNLQQEFALSSAPTAALASSLEHRRLRFYIFLMLADIGLLFLAFILSGYLYIGRRTAMITVLLPAQLLIPIYLTIGLQNGTYSLRSLKDWRAGAANCVAALLISAALVNLLAFFAKLNAHFSRVGFAVGLVIAAALLILLRKVAIAAVSRRWGPAPVNVLVIDDGGPPIELAHAYRAKAAGVGLRPSLDDPHALDLLARYVRNMDQVIVSCPAERRVAWAMVLKGSGIHGEVLSDYMREIGALGVINRDDIGITTLLISTGPLGLRARAIKRILDVAASLLALGIALPILAVAAIAIKLEDRGPILFRQQRIGRRNQLFSIYKLRTMKVERTDAHGNRSASKDDDRVTAVGRFLRRTSIDELPQLFNVLRGDMSLVGPRPHAIGSLAGDKLFWEVDQRYWQRHSLRPGLTGLAQIRGFRGATEREADLTSRLQADLEYISGWTIWRDLRILAATSRVLLHDRAF
jgi:exopolysaccharide biosynthesis polyprenyl glycosylphosphotransferase